MTRSLFHLLDHAASASPNRVALRQARRTLSYEQFHARAQSVACHLVDHGLQRPDRVGILMGRSCDSMAAIFGTLGAGGAYVPLDPSSSGQRSAAMLRSAGARYLLTEPALGGLAGIVAEQAGVPTVIGLGAHESASWESIFQDRRQLPDLGLNERDLAVMFHTSGTTGVPKGVAHSHRSMLSVVEWAVDEFDLTSDDVFIGVTSHSFELSWLEIFASILARGEIVLAPDEEVQFSPGQVSQLAADSRVSVWCSVPSLLMRLSQRGDLEQRDLSALRRIHFAGERFPTRHLRRLMAQVPHARFCNMLGTTETHICAFHELRGELPDDAENIPVGKACAHVNLAAIGRDAEPVADGEVGELVVRGPCLMNGYWQLPERTEEAIIDCRFAPDLVDKAYRTGDLVRRDERGDYHIIGRADRRIKVSGHLVDLDEVEAVLLAGQDVVEGAAFAAGEEGFEHVEAAVVATRGRRLSAAALRVQVAQTLPIHAVPERIYVLDELPRLGNGKVSRRAVRESAPERDSDSDPSGDSRAVRPIDRLREYIAEQILEDPTAEIDEAADLQSAHILTSLSVVRVVGFIEECYGVAVPNEEFVAENFKSLRDIGNLVDRITSPR